MASLHSPESTPLPPLTRPPVRWWLAGVIVALFAAGLGVVELKSHDSSQQKWMAQALVGIVSIGLLFLWFLFASRFSGRVKFRGVAWLIGLSVVWISLFKFEGVSGDLIPQFSWRWGHHAQLTVPVVTATSGLPPVPTGAVDFPQFQGPTRDGKLAGPKLARDWQARPPQLLWRQPIGEGWSGFVTAGGVAVTQEQRGDQELVVAYELTTGKLLWSDAETTRYDNSLGGIGPRATPTIADGRVYAMGATGHFHVLDLATGKRLWSKNIIESNASSVPEWGVSASPLIFGDAVIVVAGQAKGGTLAAYHKVDGTRLWIGGNQGASYSSPIITKLEGQDQLVYLGANKLIGLDPANGKMLWEGTWTNKYPNVAVPVVLGAGEFLISSGYGKGSAKMKVTHPEPAIWQAEEIWKTLKMKAKFANLISYKGYIYGLDDGIFACQDPQDDGQLKWKDGRYGHGQCLLVNDLILMMTEKGDVILVDPSPTGLQEVAQMEAFTDKTWNPPALAGEYLLIRNDREAACFRLAVEAGLN